MDIRSSTLGNASANLSAPHVVPSADQPWTLVATPRTIAAVVVFAVSYPLVLFEITALRLCSTTILLTAACLMVVTGAVKQEEVYEILGQRHNHATIFMLIGVLILFQYIEREQVFLKLLRRLLKPSIGFKQYIFRLCLVTFLTSALFSSDACCFVITPLVLKLWESHERNPVELETIVLGIATSANIGSVCTVFGNLQMMLIAARRAPNGSQGLNMRQCLFYLGIPAVVVFILNMFFLNLHQYFTVLSKSKIVVRARAWSRTNMGFTPQTSGAYPYKPPRSPGSPRNRRMNITVNNLYDRSYSNESNEIRIGMTPMGLDRPVCTLETILEDEILEVVIEERKPSNPTDRTEYKDEDETNATTPCLQNNRNDVIQNGGDVTETYDDVKRNLRNNSLDKNFKSEKNCSDNTHGKTSKLSIRITDSNGYNKAEDKNVKSSKDDVYVNITEVDYKDRSEKDCENSHNDMESKQNGDGPLFHTEYKPGKLSAKKSTESSEKLVKAAASKSGWKISGKIGVYRSLTSLSTTMFLPADMGATSQDDQAEDEWSSSHSGLFQLFTCFVLIMVIVLQLCSNSYITFDSGFVAVCGAVLVVLLDAINNKHHSSVAISRMNWNVVIALCGLFVLFTGVSRTKFPLWAWHNAGLGDLNSLSVVQGALLCLLVVICSNLFHGVAVTLIVLDLISHSSSQQSELHVLLLLAWCTSLAGNFTLYGNTASLIAAQKAKQTVNHKLRFLQHLRYGLPTSLLTTLIGVLVMYGLMQI